MFHKISAYFSGSHRQPTTTAPPEIPASRVSSLNQLSPLLRDAKVSDDKQVRLSHGMWKVKPNPGAQVTRSAREHIDAAITGNRALLTQSLRDLGCSSDSASGQLIQRIRGLDDTALTVGHLRSERQALDLIGLAKPKGLSADKAVLLVNQALLRHNQNRDLTLEKDVPALADQMAANPALSFQEALKVLRAAEALNPTDFESTEARPKAAVNSHAAATTSPSPSARRSYHPVLETVLKTHPELAKLARFKLDALSALLDRRGEAEQPHVTSALKALKLDPTIGQHNVCAKLAHLEKIYFPVS